MNEANDFGELQVSDMSTMYNVSTEAFVETVYPANGTMLVNVTS